MKRQTLFTLIFAFTGVSALHAQQPPSAVSAISSAPGRASAVNVVDVAATVVAIDKATRTVTLRGPLGRTVDVMCGDEVRNFDQIRVGDLVKARYRESLSLELKKAAGQPGAAGAAMAARAPAGAKPAGAIGREIQMLADVVAVDPAKGIVSLKGPRGNIVDLKVNDQAHFKMVRVGDQVDALYTEALAITVTPMPQAPASPTR